MLNFDWSYELPEGVPALSHERPWEPDATDGAQHEDGYLLGVGSLLRLASRLVEDLESAPPSSPSSPKRTKSTRTWVI